MVAVLIMFYVVAGVCAVVVMISSMTDNIMFIPSIVVTVLEVVAITGMAVSWVKSRKEEKEKIIRKSLDKKGSDKR